MNKIKKPKKVLSAIEQIQRQEDRIVLRMLDKAIGNNEMRISIQPFALGYALIGVDYGGRLLTIQLGESPEQCVKHLLDKWNTSSYRLQIDYKAPDASLIDSALNVLNGDTTTYNFQIELFGTMLQKQVWETLRSIPFGQTQTYQQIAEKIGSPTAYRAVANAVGANPIAVLIPCHRVIRSDGTMGGYRWGDELKRKLLARERIAT